MNYSPASTPVTAFPYHSPPDSFRYVSNIFTLPQILDSPYIAKTQKMVTGNSSSISISPSLIWLRK